MAKYWDGFLSDCSIELLFDVVDAIRGFKPFIVIIFFIEIDEICFGLSLTATTGTIPGVMTRLSAFETVVVGISWGWPSGVVLRGWSEASGVSLCTSFIVWTPIWGSSTS